MPGHPIPTPAPARCAICDQPIHWGGTVDPGWVHDEAGDMRSGAIIHAARPTERVS